MTPRLIENNIDTVILQKNYPNYPSALNKHMGEDAPKSLTAIGNIDILRHNSTGLFCSQKCPVPLGLQKNICHTLRHQEIDYGDYIAQLIYLLFLTRINRLKRSGNPVLAGNQKNPLAKAQSFFITIFSSSFPLPFDVAFRPRAQGRGAHGREPVERRT